MSAGDAAERFSEELADRAACDCADRTSGSATDDCNDDIDNCLEPASQPNRTRPGERRRKTGVHYRPV